jgi:hypothetical protein
MKKILFAVIGFVMIGCTNPSMEEGLADLNAKLAALEAEIVAADIAGMEADVAAMTVQVEEALASAIESNETLEAALVTISEIKDRLAALQVTLDLAATEEQIADIKIKVAQISEGIAYLVFRADYDYDGVMNGLDQCPDTPIEQITSVDANGCSPEQLAG